MPAAITLDGPPVKSVRRDGCRCVRNRRTGKAVKLCPVPKSSKHRSGWAFVKGPCTDD